MTNERILEKIRKCLALANDKRGDPNTAAIALRQAQALMRQHNIDEVSVDASICGDQYLQSKFSVKKPAQWETNLMVRVAEAFACDVLWAAGGPAPTRKGHWRFVGPKGHLEVCIHTAIVLMRQLLAARNTFVREQVPDYWNRGRKSQEADSFCRGWIVEVCKTVAAYADPDGTLKDARHKYLTAKLNVNLEMTVQTNKRRVTSSGFSAGAEQGSKVRLHRPVDGAGMQTPLQLTKE